MAYKSFNQRFPMFKWVLLLAILVTLPLTVFSVQKVSTNTDQHAASIYKISGIVYEDVNGNGVKDSNETYFNGARVSLSGFANTTITTANNGVYSFNHLMPGSYFVKATLPSNFSETRPNPKYVELGPNKIINFGFRLTKLTPTPTRTPPCNPRYQRCAL